MPPAGGTAVAGGAAFLGEGLSNHVVGLGSASAGVPGDGAEGVAGEATAAVAGRDATAEADGAGVPASDDASSVTWLRQADHWSATSSAPRRRWAGPHTSPDGGASGAG
ncbi:hypothetical protein ACFQ71_25300, partial [Streptomyces sp. NPDC056534]